MYNKLIKENKKKKKKKSKIPHCSSKTVSPIDTIRISQYCVIRKMNQKRNIRAHECKTVKYGAILNVRFDKASYIFIHLILILALIYIYITRFLASFFFLFFFLQNLIYLINIDKNINLDEHWNFYLAV